MPIHNWAVVSSGLFHHFHQTWIVEICNQLNGGLLPGPLYALVEQRAVGLIPDVLTLTAPAPPGLTAGAVGAILAAPPTARFMVEADPDPYVARASRLVVRAAGAELVAVVEIVSPGNKAGRAGLRAFVETAAEFLSRGVHLLIVDLLPPSPRDPQGIHKAIWDEIQDDPFELPREKPLTLAAYSAGPPIRAFVEPVGVGDALPPMPLFLDSGLHVLLPLETTYQAAWSHCPLPLRRTVESAPIS